MAIIIPTMFLRNTVSEDKSIESTIKNGTKCRATFLLNSPKTDPECGTEFCLSCRMFYLVLLMYDLGFRMLYPSFLLSHEPLDVHAFWTQAYNSIFYPTTTYFVAWWLMTFQQLLLICHVERMRGHCQKKAGESGALFWMFDLFWAKRRL